MSKTTIKPGAVMRYVGDDHRFMKGLKVKVLNSIIDDNEQPTGWWDVAPWIEKDGRFSWVTSDARREDLVPIDTEGKS